MLFDLISSAFHRGIRLVFLALLMTMAATSKIAFAAYPDIPLPNPSGFVRLLVLHPPAPDGHLRLSMSQYLLTDDLKYNALSYEWGTCTTKHTISVNDQPMNIYDNVFAFLTHLQNSQHSHLPFFADAICINQASVEERNAQAQIMGCIYGGVQLCLAWLGESRDGSDFIFETFHEERDWLPELEHERGNQYHSLPEIDSIEKGRALNAQYLRPYWTRLWIIQEMYLPQQVIFFCGAKTMSWKVLKHLSKLRNSALSRNGLGQIDSNEREGWLHMLELFNALNARDQDRCENETSNVDLSHLVTHLKYAKCRDIRDKVYGLLGIVEAIAPRELRSKLVVDYGMSTFELFIHVLRTMSPYADLSRVGRLFEALELQHDYNNYLPTGGSEDLIAALPSPLSEVTMNIDVFPIGTLRLNVGIDLGPKDTCVNGADITQFMLLIDRGPSDSSLSQAQWLMLYDRTCVCETSAQEGDQIWWFVGSRMVMIKQLDQARFTRGVLFKHGEDEFLATIAILDRYMPLTAEHSAALFSATNTCDTLHERTCLRDFMMLLEHAITAYPDWLPYMTDRDDEKDD